jgi:hypothetical protein
VTETIEVAATTDTSPERVDRAAAVRSCRGYSTVTSVVPLSTFTSF